MTKPERATVRACAAIVEARGRTDLALRLLALIPDQRHNHDQEEQ